MDKQAEIKKIIIKIGDKEASLAPDEALELLDVLEGLLGKKKVEYVLYPRWPTPVYPYWTWRNTKSTSDPARWNDTICISANVNNSASFQ